MRLDPDRFEDLSRLRKCIERGYNNLADFRRRREKFIRRFVGHNYKLNDGGEILKRFKKATVVNLIGQLVETYSHKMTANNPRVSCETEFDFLKPFATRLRLSLNRLIEEIDFKAENRAIVTDALFYVGIAKIHNGRSFELDFGEEYGRIDPGRPSVYRVSLDDWFHDPTARCLRELGFCGNFYKKPLDAVLDDPNIPDEAKDKAFASSRDDSGAQLEKTTPVANLSRDDSKEDELEKMVDLTDVWLPRERLIITMLKESDGAPPLRVHEWGGVEHGPYRMLTFQEVPDNLMGLSTVGNVEMLHDLYNTLMNQLKEQALQAKIIPIYVPRAQEDMKGVMRAKNGEAVPVQSKEDIGTIAFPGADPRSQAFAMQIMQLFDRAGGNLAVAAGYGQGADTLGQTEILAGAVSSMEAARMHVVQDFNTHILRDLGYLHWHDQFTQQENTLSIGPLSIPMGWTPGDRQGNYDQFTLKVEPYSTQYTSPVQKVNALDRVMNTYIMPLMPLILQRGDQIDTAVLFDFLAEAFDIPALRDMIKSGAPSLRDPNQFAQDLFKPGSGNKPNGNYTRTNRTAPGGEGNQQMQALLTGAGADPGGGVVFQ